MSLRFALLGLLAERPSSGYDLSRRFEEGIGSFAWAAGHSQIYPELKKLDERGLVTVVSQGARGRKLYDVTAGGREELRAWLLSPPSDRGTVRNEFVLRLFLLSSLEPTEAAGLLDEVEASCERQIDVLEKERADLADDTSGPACAAVYGIFAFTATRDWARWARGHLRSADDARPSVDDRAPSRT